MSGGISAGALALGAVAASVILPKLLAPSGGGGSNTTQAAAPTLAAPTAMPTAGDESVNAAKRASIAEQLRRRGRASTVLTDTNSQSDALGG